MSRSQVQWTKANVKAEVIRNKDLVLTLPHIALGTYLKEFEAIKSFLNGDKKMERNLDAVNLQIGQDSPGGGVLLLRKRNSPRFEPTFFVDLELNENGDLYAFLHTSEFSVNTHTTKLAMLIPGLHRAYPIEENRFSARLLNHVSSNQTFIEHYGPGGWIKTEFDDKKQKFDALND